MELSDAQAFLADHHKAVIATVGEDGTPHLTNVVAGWDGTVFRVSLTDARVKTDNLRRTPVAVLSISSDDFWRYVSAECDVELSPTSTTPGDDVGQELLALHDELNPEPHPDPDEFLAAMVEDRRLVARLTPRRVYGQLSP